MSVFACVVIDILCPHTIFIHLSLECKGHQHNKRTKIITTIMNCDYAYIVSLIVAVVVLFQIWLCSPQLNAKKIKQN